MFGIFLRLPRRPGIVDVLSRHALSRSECQYGVDDIEVPFVFGHFSPWIDLTMDFLSKLLDVAHAKKSSRPREFSGSVPTGQLSWSEADM